VPGVRDGGEAIHPGAAIHVLVPGLPALTRRLGGSGARDQ
jgi:hypothetical protein